MSGRQGFLHCRDSSSKWPAVNSVATKDDRSSDSMLRRIQEHCERFRRSQQHSGTRVTLEQFLREANDVAAAELFPRLLEIDIELRCARGQNPAPTDYLSCFPEFSRDINRVFMGIDTQRDARAANHGQGESSSAETAAEDHRRLTHHQPETIGRYKIKKRLGHGGFGVVYLASDEKLERLVAIKVPHRQVVHEAKDIELYLHEARAVAKLDHPHIVPVYDVGGDNIWP